MKSQGFSQTPPDIMEEYNGCSVPQYTAYRPTGVYPLISAYLMLGNDLIFTDRIVLISSIKYAEIVE